MPLDRTIVLLLAGLAAFGVWKAIQTQRLARQSPEPSKFWRAQLPDLALALYLVLAISILLFAPKYLAWVAITTGTLVGLFAARHSAPALRSSVACSLKEAQSPRLLDRASVPRVIRSLHPVRRPRLRIAPGAFRRALTEPQRLAAAAPLSALGHVRQHEEIETRERQQREQREWQEEHPLDQLDPGAQGDEDGGDDGGKYHRQPAVSLANPNVPRQWDLL